jgi:hypothetical protein
VVLAQRFLRVERDRQYVPERGRQGDLEKLRDFGERAQGKDWLKVFHTEAVRGEYKHAWQQRDYRLIVTVAMRLPPSIDQEDARQLASYDNALMRAEAEPVQAWLLQLGEFSGG